jgi:hypothetical protein
LFSIELPLDAGIELSVADLDDLLQTCVVQVVPHNLGLVRQDLGRYESRARGARVGEAGRQIDRRGG